jgi:hypothetical protein
VVPFSHNRNDQGRWSSNICCMVWLAAWPSIQHAACMWLHDSVELSIVPNQCRLWPRLLLMSLCLVVRLTVIVHSGIAPPGLVIDIGSVSR